MRTHVITHVNTRHLSVHLKSQVHLQKSKVCKLKVPNQTTFAVQSYSSQVDMVSQWKKNAKWHNVKIPYTQKILFKKSTDKYAPGFKGHSGWHSLMLQIKVPLVFLSGNVT